MRRLPYVMCFLGSVALTFHFLQSRSLRTRDGPAEAGFRVLQGNVTVHVGEEATFEDPAFVLNPEGLCSQFDDSRTRLLVVVVSRAKNLAQRQAVRDTWGLRSLQTALNFRTVFILGRSGGDAEDIDQESARYGDIVQIDAEETFRNLGLKSAAGLRWSKDHCPSADFVVKTDDDILVHVPNLLRALRSSKEPGTLLLCHENRMRKILRKESLANVPKNYDKYEVRESELPGVYYPPYCSGMAYAFSRQVRDRLLWASSVTPVFFIEDVYLTGFCRHKAGVLITPCEGIALRPPISPAQAACAFRDGRVTSQEVDAAELRQLWAEINTNGFFCPRLLGYARKPSAKLREHPPNTLKPIGFS